MKCYHIFSNYMVVYLAKNHYGSYSPQMVPTNPLAHGLSVELQINLFIIIIIIITCFPAPSLESQNGGCL